jgi:L-ribulose-5-phosphate 3-epimerase
MNLISFMSANFVARQLNYNMPLNQWAVGDGATQAWFRPLESFEQRFDELLGEVAALGFTAIDIWLAHLHPNWATRDHIAVATCLWRAPKHDGPTLAKEGLKFLKKGAKHAGLN